MTTYGTIPTSTPSSTDPSPIGFISRAKDRGRDALAALRPWRELANRHAFSLPHGISDAGRRVATNLSYFAANYAIVALLILFLSLLYHPTSLIVFVVLMGVWLFLYFLRDEPLVILHREVGDKAVLIVLGLLTVGLLLLTGATGNIVVSVLIGAVIVLAHAVMRKPDDLFLEEGAGEEEERMSGGWYRPVG